MRQLKREVKIGNLTIGGNNPVAVQTMLNVPVEDVAGNVAQAKRVAAAGTVLLPKIRAGRAYTGWGWMCLPLNMPRSCWGRSTMSSRACRTMLFKYW